MRYGKVDPYEWIKRDFIGDLLIGACPNCGAEVRYHSKGFDEECYECGCGLDWETFEEDFKKKYGGLK